MGEGVKNSSPETATYYAYARISGETLWAAIALYLRFYLVTRSNHLTIPNITPIETMQTMKNTAQHCQIGQALYISGPTHNIKLPTAVAPSHKPWHKPNILFGATLDTNERPSGEMNNSATVRKKYKAIRIHQ